MSRLGEMHAYYSARAPHMAEKLDVEPTGQLLEIITELQCRARDRNVLEVACGTGYWTRHIAPLSKSLVAMDFSDEMLARAKSQKIPHATIVHDDAYQLANVGKGSFDFGYAMHWVSHIPMSRWAEFFIAFHVRLKAGAQVLLADDIHRTDDTDPYYSKLDSHDSFEVRHLPDGTTYEIVKTYFTPESLRELLKPFASKIEIHFERPRWWVTYQVKA